MCGSTLPIWRLSQQSYITDTDVHAPPTTGVYPYSPPGSFLPGSGSFPAVGATYIDPVFGTSIRRLTNEEYIQSNAEHYAQNGWWNANATRFVHFPDNTIINLINPDTGAVVRSDLPRTAITSFDPVDPDIWYYGTGSSLRKFNISSGADSLVKTFAATLEGTGGSVDWIDATGRYFVIAYSSVLHIWDKQTDTIFTGTVATSLMGGGWAGITPNASHLVVASGPHYSFAINTGAQTLATSGVQFWSLCGDHGDLVSASDGKSYMITFECTDTAEIYRVDITLDQSAATNAQQRAANVSLVDTDFWDAGHFSGVTTGPLKDWCFISIETQDDTFAAQSTWRPYKQEIIAVNVITGVIRRLAHHRSRTLSGKYYHQPRICASWDGSRIAWGSNMGHDADPIQYCDIYTLSPGF